MGRIFLNPQSGGLQRLLDLRRASDAELLFEDDDRNGLWRLFVQRGVETVWTEVAKGTETDNGPIDAIVSAYGNREPAAEEIRFITRDFANPASWDGLTNGDPAKAWALDHGAVSYDDVAYAWLDADGAAVVTLDQTEDGIGSVWRDADDVIVVQWVAGPAQWQRLDTSADVTSSRWSMVPYPGHLIKLVKANTLFGSDTVMQSDGALHYKILAAGGAVAVRDFVYRDTDHIRLASDDWRPINGDFFAGYDYRDTVHPKIDSRVGMRLEISLENHKPVVSATGRKALASFVGVKIWSY